MPTSSAHALYELAFLAQRYADAAATWQYHKVVVRYNHHLVSLDSTQAKDGRNL